MSEPATQIDPPTRHDSAAEPPIPLLRWPDQEAERRRLVALGEPRILLISQYTTPPGLLDDLELWILDGAEPSGILAAVDELRRRTSYRQPEPEPVLDEDGLLWFKGSWVDVPDAQLPVVDLLVRNVNRLVHNDDLRAAYQARRGGTSLSSYRTVIHRVSHRVLQVGLRLHVIRARGAVLATTPPEAPSRDLAGSQQ